MKKTIPSLILIVTVAIVGFFYVIPEKKKQVALTPTHSFATWTEFKDYKRLNMLLRGLAVESLIDIPAHDLQELMYHHLDLKSYTGLTPTKEKAQGLQAQFGGPMRTFAKGQIVQDPLPYADMILCWDSLSTLTESEVKAALVQFRKSGAKYILMRHFPHMEKNNAHPDDTFHPINWKLPPYNFPEPLIQIEQKEQTTLALWSLESL